MRLIDADGSYTLNASDNTGYSLSFGGGIISVADEYGHIEAEFFADDAFAVDAVPVVRCEDCKHGEFVPWCSKYSCRKVEGLLNFCDFYCKDGVRKEGDT